MALKQVSSGLLLRENFATLSAWSGTGWSSASDPSLVAFDPSPILALSPGTAGSVDYDGVREGQLYVEGSAWTLLYDGGDDTHGWTQFTATSTDKGLTWTKNGTQSVGYSDGAGGTHSATATGWIEKRGSTYYLYRVTANDVYTAPIGQGLPKGPYGGDIWTASSLGGAWTFLRTFPTDGTGWAAGQNLPGSVYFDGTTYHFFNEGFNGTIGRYHATSIAGSWTEDTTQITGYLADGRFVENPKVFNHSGLGRYVMLANAVNPSTQDQNSVWLSTSLTDWSAAGVHRIQHVSPLDSVDTIGQMAHVTGPDGALIAEPDGTMPVVYDGLPRGNSPSWELGRSILYAALEPSPSCARYTHADTTARRITRTLTNGDFVAEWSVELRSIDASLGSLIFEFRRQDDANFYRLVLLSTGLRLDKLVSNSSTVLQSASSPAETGAVNLVHRLRLIVSGTSIKAWLNGEAQIDTTDSTYGSGSSIAFMGDDCDGDVRLFSLRSAQTVTIKGVQAGQVVTLRGAGGLPIVTTTAGSSSVTLTAPHYPQVSFDVDSMSYAPPSGIWGGDVYSINASPLPFAFG